MTPPPAGAVAVPAPAVRPRRRVGGPPSHGRPARPLRAARRPRRISGPTRPAAGTPERTGQRLPYHLLDRLIRGRAWIAVVAFALLGIVAAQLWVIKLNVGIGRAIEHAATLQRENSALAVEDSALSSGERIEQLASAHGMVPAPPGALHFDTVRGSLDVRLAAAALARPTQQATASATAGTEASTSTATGGEPASAEAASAPSASTETPSAPGESASSPSAATATTPSTTAASTPEPSATSGALEVASAPAATGGASEAPASAPASEGGGTQAAPGG